MQRGIHKLRRQYYEDFFAPSSLSEKLFHKLLKQFRWYLATPPSPMLVCVVYEWPHNRFHTITRGHNQHSSHGNWFSYTLRLKSHWPFASVCYKTTLNTGGEGGTGEDHQTLKMRTSFLMSLAFGIPILNNFQKRSFWRNPQTKISTFIVIKREIFVWDFLPKLHFIRTISKLVYEVQRT